MFKGKGLGIKHMAIVCLFAGFSVNSAATLMTFNDQATFQTGLGANSSSTLSFDNVADGTLIVNGSNFQGIDFSFTDSIGSPFDGQVANGFETTSGSNYLGFSDPNSNAFLSGDNIAMHFAQTVHAIGLFIIASPGDLFSSDDAVLAAGSGSAMVNPVPNGVLNDGGEVFFLGLIDTDGFTSAELSTICCDFFEFNVDDIQFSTFATASPKKAIAEPATVTLFCFSLLLGLRQRKANTNRGG